MKLNLNRISIPVITVFVIANGLVSIPLSDHQSQSIIDSKKNKHALIIKNLANKLT